MTRDDESFLEELDEAECLHNATNVLIDRFDRRAIGRIVLTVADQRRNRVGSLIVGEQEQDVESGIRRLSKIRDRAADKQQQADKRTSHDDSFKQSIGHLRGNHLHFLKRSVLADGRDRVDLPHKPAELAQWLIGGRSNARRLEGFGGNVG